MVFAFVELQHSDRVAVVNISMFGVTEHNNVAIAVLFHIFVCC